MRRTTPAGDRNPAETLDVTADVAADIEVENFQGMPWDEFLEILDKRAAKKFPPKKQRKKNPRA
jgi:hypothetical protein